MTGERVSESGLQNALDIVLAKLLVDAPLQISCVAPLHLFTVHVQNVGGGDISALPSPRWPHAAEAEQLDLVTTASS